MEDLEPNNAGQEPRLNDSQTSDLTASETHGGMRRIYAWLVLISFLVGFMTSYVIWGRKERPPVAVVQAQPPAITAPASAPTKDVSDLAGLIAEVNPPEGYTLPASYGELGPQMIKAGVIDYDAFAAIYADSSPLSPEEIQALQTGSDEPIVINSENSHFLLNFFWAVGLANKNPILTEGPIVQYSEGQIDRFASTGGWGLASKPVMEIYASLDLIPLTQEQQARVEEAAREIYRPCCDNATYFPDCNHGMAMLGLLELMAAQDAGVDEMLEAAKYVNAFWFPQQTIETAIYLKSSMDLDFTDADARLIVGKKFSSGSGSAQVHQALQAAGLLEQAPGSGNGCAN